MARHGFLFRLKRLWYAFLNNFITGIEDKHLEDLALQEIREMENDVREGKEALVRYAGLIESLKGQIEAGKQRIKELEKSVLKYRNINREVAAKMAVELSHVKEDLQKNQEQLLTRDETYQNFLLKLKKTMEKIDRLRQDIKEKAVQMRVEEAFAKASEAVARVAGIQFDTSTGLNEILSRMQEKINTAKGRVRVVGDLSSQGVEELEAEEEAEKAIAEEELRKYEVEHGLVPAEAAAEEEVKEVKEKTIGPAKKATK